MPPGPLRTAIESWVTDKFPAPGGPGWWARVQARWSEFGEVSSQARAADRTATAAILVIPFLAQAGYALTGNENVIGPLRDIISGKLNSDVSTSVAAALRGVFSQPEASEIAETLGALITEPVLTLFEKYAGRDDLDPKEFARAFHGFMIGLNVSGGLADTILESVTGGQVEGAGRMLQSMYWSLGLGFLGWQTLAPLLTAGLQPGLERFYNNLYRPARFTAGDLRDLYALGKITRAQLADEAAHSGWRDKDIDNWVELAFRSLTQGDIWKAFHEGLMSESEAQSRLRALGYDPDDIPLLFQLNPKEEQSEARSFTVSTARAAYRQHLLGESELRSILAELNYQEREIALIVQLENLGRDAEARSLSIGQIKDAWASNVITDPEAIHWLSETGLGDDEIAILLDTWSAELVPAYRMLNLGTITGAYVEGILSRDAAQSKLVAIGLRAEDARLELDLAEARNPAVFAPGQVTTRRELSPSNLADLFTSGVITLEQLRTRLVGLGYAQADADLLAEAARVRLLEPERKLPQSSIERAYLAGVLDRPAATVALVLIGYTQDSAGVVLTTLELENPAVFDLPLPERLRDLSPGVLEDLVIGGQITPETMYDRLLDLGFTAGDAALLVERARQLSAPPVRILGQSTIERAYLAGILDRTQALEKLLEADFPPEEAAVILATVEAENPGVFNPELVTSIRLPSIGALAQAVASGLITEPEYYARAAELGYRAQDVAIYLGLATRQERKATTQLSPSQIVNAYGAGFLPWGVALSRLTQRGYSDPDATLLLRMEKDLIANTDVWDQLLQGAIGPFDALAQLMSMQYADQDILDAFASLSAAQLAGMEIDLTQLAAALKATPGGE